MNVKKLKVMIAKKQWSIERLAAEAGVSPDVVYRAMRGSKPTLATVGKIAAALDVDPGELMQED